VSQLRDGPCDAAEKLSQIGCVFNDLDTDSHPKDPPPQGHLGILNHLLISESSLQKITLLHWMIAVPLENMLNSAYSDAQRI
jgi:hypothetical protein